MATLILDKIGRLFLFMEFKHTVYGTIYPKASRKHAYIILTPLNPTFI